MNKSNYDLGLLVQRLWLGALMLFHGIHKLQYGIDFIVNMLAAKVIPSFVAYGAYIGEIIAPIFIILGIKTRLASLVYAINMLVAVLMVHTDQFFDIGKNGEWRLEMIAAYFLGAIVLVIMGGGKYSISKD